MANLDEINRKMTSACESLNEIANAVEHAAQVSEYEVLSIAAEFYPKTMTAAMKQRLEELTDRLWDPESVDA